MQDQMLYHLSNSGESEHSKIVHGAEAGGAVRRRELRRSTNVCPVRITLAGQAGWNNRGRGAKSGEEWTGEPGEEM